MLLIIDDLTQLSQAALSASHAAAGMPESNLRVLQPSVRWRALTEADTPWVELSFGGGYGTQSIQYDTIALLAYDGSPTRNLLRNPGRPASTPWSATGTFTSAPTIAPPAAIPFQAWSMLSSSGGGALHTELTGIQSPGKASPVTGADPFPFTLGMPVKQATGDVDLLLIAYSTLLTAEARSAFDLSAGTVKGGSPTSAGGWLASSAAIVSLGDGWYLPTLSLVTEGADAFSVRFAGLTPGGSTTIPEAEGLYFGMPAALPTGSDVATVTEWPHLHDISGPMFRVRLHAGDITVNETVADRTAWLPAATRNVLRGFGRRYSFFHRYAALQTEPNIRVELYDPYNTNGYLEAGRLVVGRSLKLKGTIIGHGLDESGGQAEADGGQIYRPQRKVRRVEELVLRYSDRATAYDELHYLRRVQGRSRQVLVVAEESEAKYMQEGLVYGYIDDLPPLPISGSNASWTIPMTVVETP